MGAQQILRAAAVALATAATAHADKLHERVAVIDLGPRDAALATRLSAAVVANGLDPVAGDGVEAALAGVASEPDAVLLAAALAEAQRAYGALDCKAATDAGKRAAGIGASRQAAGLAVPELPRAWSYVLLCADRTGDLDGAMIAASRLAALGATEPADLIARYPAVDSIIDREIVEVDIKAEAGAAVWIDHVAAGTAPLHVALTAGDHLIAAARGHARGWVSGTAVKKQPIVEIPLVAQRGAYDDVAQEIASWGGKLPTPAQLGKVLVRVHARIALVRHGDTVEAFGQAGAADLPHQLGGDDGVAPSADVARVLALITDRVHAWNDHAPDPDRALLVEGGHDRPALKREEPTAWWVYATIIGALGGVALAVYLHDTGSDSQRVELHYP